HVPAGDGDRSAGHTTVPGEVADDRKRRRRLPASRLADEPGGLAAADLERDTAEHGAVDPAHRVHDVDVAKLECGCVGHPWSTCWTESETRLTATTSDAIASAGNSTDHHSKARSW